MTVLITYVSVAIVFVMTDLVWLTTMSARLYKPVLGDMLRPQPNLFAAGVFYVLYPIGLLRFAVLPAQHDGSVMRALVSGVMLGCLTYATYDLTNQATLRNWSTTLTVADICWGSFLAGLSASVGDLLPCLPSFIRRVCSGFGPDWGGLQTRSV